MKLNATGFASFLRDGAGIVAALVYGPDAGLARESAKQIKQKWQPQADPFGETLFVAGEVPDTLIDDLNAYGFGNADRLVEIRNPDQKDVKNIIAAMNALQSQTAPPVAKLLVQAGELTPSSALRKAFEAPKRQDLVAFACYADRDGDVARIVREAVQENGHKIDAAALAMFVENVPRDRSILRNELDKLFTYLADMPGSSISPDLVQSLICQDGDVGFDDVAQYCAEGDMGQADAALERALEAGQHPAMLVRTISRHFQRLHEVARATDQGESVTGAMARLRPPVFVMQKARFQSQANRWNTSRLQTVLSQALETERDLKTSVLSPNSVLGRFVLQVCSLAR